MKTYLKNVSLAVLVCASLSTPSRAFVPTQEDYNVTNHLQNVIEGVVEKVKPAVVNISTVSKVRVNNPLLPPDFKGFFHEFGMPMPFENMPHEFEERALGSGFVVDEENGWAYILTNYHVVRGADSIRVKLSNGEAFKGHVVGGDPKTDVALVKIHVGKRKVPTVTLGSSSDIKVGELVIAVGNPYGLNWTVTHGIVSAKGRYGLGLNPVEDFIQTDAAINPGNSGGPLCDIHGNVIGINAAIVRNAQGLGFAVPIDIAKRVMKDILKYGKVVRGWLGVYISDLSPDVASKFGINHGVLIQKVVKESPACKAGLKSGDIILSYNGRPIKNVADLQLNVMSTKPNSVVNMGIIRNGVRKIIRVKIGSSSAVPCIASKSLLSKFGFSAQSLNAGLKQKLNVPSWIRHGLVITEVKPGSVADDDGLREGDIILQAGMSPRTLRDMKTLGDLSRVLNHAKGNGILLKVMRNGAVLYIVLGLSH